MGDIIVVRPRSALGRRIECERARAASLNGEATGGTIAGDGRLDRSDVIDLSRVVSAYVSETEKNLRRLFERAERSEHVLVYDEADELFGARSPTEAAPCVRLSAADFAEAVRVCRTT